MVTTSLGDSAASPKKILVVDSNTVHRSILKRQLERLGHTVAIAIDGFEAVEILLNGGFDAVLVDLQMPGLDRHTIARRLRACGSNSDIRILGITALREPDERERDLAAGIDDVLIKPIGLAELEYRLTRLLKLEEPTEVRCPRRGRELGSDRGARRFRA